MNREVEVVVKGLNRKKFIWLLTAILSLIVFFVVRGITYSKINVLPDQQAGDRWDEEGGYSQVSLYFPKTSGVIEKTIDQFRYDLSNNFAKESIEVTSENPSARLFAMCYLAEGNLSIRSKSSTLNIHTLGVGGDFFMLHQFDLLSGYYFLADDLNDDYCVIDEVAAWKLFGSTDVAGQQILVGEVPLIIRGVIKQPEDEVSKAAGSSSEICYVSYSFLEEHGNIGGITNVELIVPNPVPGFAVSTIKATFPVNEDDMVIVENSNRFSLENRWYLLKNIKSRSMVTQDISFPWWENVARSVEDTVVFLTLIYLIFLVYAVSVILILLIMLIVQNRYLIKAFFIEIGKLIADFFGKLFSNIKKSHQED